MYLVQVIIITIQEEQEDKIEIITNNNNKIADNNDIICVPEIVMSLHKMCQLGEMVEIEITKCKLLT